MTVYTDNFAGLSNGDEFDSVNRTSIGLALAVTGADGGGYQDNVGRGDETPVYAPGGTSLYSYALGQKAVDITTVVQLSTVWATTDRLGVAVASSGGLGTSDSGYVVCFRNEAGVMKLQINAYYPDGSTGLTELDEIDISSVYPTAASVRTITLRVVLTFDGGAGGNRPRITVYLDGEVVTWTSTDDFYDDDTAAADTIIADASAVLCALYCGGISALGETPASGTEPYLGFRAGVLIDDGQSAAVAATRQAWFGPGSF